MSEDTKTPIKTTSSNNVKFSFDGPKNDTPSTSADYVEVMRKSLIEQRNKTIQAQNADPLSKSVEPVVIRETDKKYDKNKIVFNARISGTNTIDGVDVKNWQRLSDRELRDLAQVDPYLSAIISTRCSQGAVIGRLSESKFDKGSRIREINPINKDDFSEQENYEKAKKSREFQMKAILSWSMTCGTDDEDLINSAFAGHGDKTFKNCTLSEYIVATIRNILTFGRYATQIFRNEDGIPVMFRPLPVETIFPYHEDANAVHIAHSDESMEQSMDDAKEFNKLDKKERPTAWIQRVDGKNVNFFTEQDIQVGYFQKQALFDLNGYPLAPIEMAIYMVYTHQQTLQYLRNQFVKGLGTKGVLNIQSTDPAAQLSDEDVAELRNEFHNFLSRNDNSAATPIISGPVQVNWVPLSATVKEMEFLQVEDHIIRALCSAMQISPQEMGYGELNRGAGGLTQSNKQQDLIQGEERGLRMLLDIVYDGINEMIYENFKEAKEKFALSYTGVGEDTREAVLERSMQEVQTTATMNSLYSASEKNESLPIGGDVPLSPTFHSSVVRYMKYGDFLEHYFKIEGASKVPEYDFIIDGELNSAYMQLKISPIQVQQKQTELQLEGQQMELQGQEQQMGMAQQQAEQQAQQGQPQGQGQPQEGAPQEAPSGSEPAEKSLHQAYQERQPLRKSMESYFEAWISAHNK